MERRHLLAVDVGKVGVEERLTCRAVWQYVEDSARFIFGAASGDPVADEILAALRGAGDKGMTRTAIANLSGKHLASGRIGPALDQMVARGVIVQEVQQTGGRPREVYRIAEGVAGKKRAA